MNYIYDIVLNFNNYCENISFYEWNSSDNFTYIEKIPIFRTIDIGIDEINNYLIKIDDDLLNKIENKTYDNVGSISYALLITDMNRVMALKFNKDGYLIEKSSLLIDEEDAVIEEANLLDLDSFIYKKLDRYNTDYFLTRLEKNIKDKLLKEIKYLYMNNKYDEINYLYFEVLSEKKDIKSKYKDLIKLINDNSFPKLNHLDEIIKLTKEKL